MNDEEIVNLYFEKNEKALSESAIKYGVKLKRISFNIVQNMSDAEECENDTYLAAWNSIPPHSPKQYLFSFFAKIIRDISINLYKKNHAKKRFAQIIELTKEMEECIPSPNDETCKVEDNELTNIINNFLFGLGIEERSVFVYRYWFAESIKEVSARFGISESKTKSMLMRTRGKLKKYFESEDLIL